MGKPSNRKRSARRLGRREREQVKKHFRTKIWISVPGADTVTLKLGRKKLVRYLLSKHTPF